MVVNGVRSNNTSRLRQAAYYTMVAPGAYLLFSFFLIAAVGGLAVFQGSASALQFASTSPLQFSATVLGEVLFHPLFFVTTVAIFATLRKSWPVRADLVLVGGAWQMIFGLTKGLSSFFTFTSLGASYATGDATLRTVLLSIAGGEYGLRTALQIMDGSGVAFVWIIVATLPAASAIPRVVRWIGWILTAILYLTVVQGEIFALVVFVFPFWLFLVGRWIARRLPKE